jgi:hypothetical protein
MLERFDRWNQRHLEKLNRSDKPVVSRGAERLMAWWHYGMLIVGVVTLLAVALVRIIG